MDISQLGPFGTPIISLAGALFLATLLLVWSLRRSAVFRQMAVGMNNQLMAARRQAEMDHGHITRLEAQVNSAEKAVQDATQKMKALKAAQEEAEARAVKYKTDIATRDKVIENLKRSLQEQEKAIVDTESRMAGIRSTLLVAAQAMSQPPAPASARPKPPPAPNAAPPQAGQAQNAPRLAETPAPKQQNQAALEFGTPESDAPTIAVSRKSS